jgi:hypothetical protein
MPPPKGDNNSMIERMPAKPFLLSALLKVKRQKEF